MCKKKKCIKLLLKESWSILCCPENWFKYFGKKRQKVKTICIAILFLLIGYCFQKKWYFPYFWAFTFGFLAIGLIALFCIRYFSNQMNIITTRLVKQPAAITANTIYYKYCVSSSLYIFIPLSVVVVFGTGGCSMFGAIQFNPTLYWVLTLFSVVVYISIIGYLQYMALTLYIYKLSHETKKYQGLQKTGINCIPAHTEWLQNLAKLYHTYRTAFFTLGSSFIVAFGLFCELPQMEAQTDSPMFLLLWGIISVAIVLVFPITAILEHKWIKRIVVQLKKAYITELEQETRLFQENIMTQKDSATQKKFLQIICVTQIMNSKDYPITSSWNTVYAIGISVFNFATSVITILQGFPILSTYLHCIF